MKVKPAKTDAWFVLGLRAVRNGASLGGWYSYSSQALAWAAGTAREARPGRLVSTATSACWSA